MRAYHTRSWDLRIFSEFNPVANNNDIQINLTDAQNDNTVKQNPIATLQNKEEDFYSTKYVVTDMLKSIRSEMFDYKSEMYNRPIDTSDAYFQLTPNTALNSVMAMLSGMKTLVNTMGYTPMMRYWPKSMPSVVDEAYALTQIQLPTIELGEHSQTFERVLSPLGNDIIGNLALTPSGISSQRSMNNLKVESFNGNAVQTFILRNQTMLLRNASYDKTSSLALGLRLRLALSSLLVPYMGDINRIALGLTINPADGTDNLYHRAGIFDADTRYLAPLNKRPLRNDLGNGMISRPYAATMSFRTFVEQYDDIKSNFRLWSFQDEENHTAPIGFQIAGYCFVDSRMSREALLNFGCHQFGGPWFMYGTSLSFQRGTAEDGTGDIINTNIPMIPISQMNKIGEIPSLSDPQLVQEMFWEDGEGVTHAANVPFNPVYIFVFCDNFNNYVEYPDIDDFYFAYNTYKLQDGTWQWGQYDFLELDQYYTNRLNIGNNTSIVNFEGKIEGLREAYNWWITRFASKVEAEECEMLCGDLCTRRTVQYAEGYGVGGDTENTFRTRLTGYRWQFGKIGAGYYINPSLANFWEGTDVDDDAYRTLLACTTSASGIRAGHADYNLEDNLILYNTTAPTATIARFNKNIVAMYLLGIFMAENQQTYLINDRTLMYWRNEHYAGKLAVMCDNIMQTTLQGDWRYMLDYRQTSYQSDAYTALDYITMLSDNKTVTVVHTEYVPGSFENNAIDLEYIAELWGERYMPIVTHSLYTTSWAKNNIRDFDIYEKLSDKLDLKPKTRIDTNTTLISFRNKPLTENKDVLHNIYWLSLTKNWVMREEIDPQGSQVTPAHLGFLSLISIGTFEELGNVNNYGWNQIVHQIYDLRNTIYTNSFPRSCLVPPHPWILFNSFVSNTDTDSTIMLNNGSAFTINDENMNCTHLWVIQSPMSKVPLTRQTGRLGTRRGAKKANLN